MQWDEVTHLTGGLLLSRGQVVTWVWTNSLYPPIYDIFTALYYLIAGPSVFAARLVAVTFSVLSLFVIYEIAKQLYNQKTALIATVLFSIMPGIVWISRMAMIETMLIFIFSISMLFFFSWLRTNNQRDRNISIIALAVGVAVKYQMLVVVPLIMLLGMYFWKRDYLKTQLKSCLRFPRLTLVVAAIVVASVVVYVLLTSGVLNVLFYAIQVGTAQKAVFSVRYPTPIFYFIEMTWFDNLTHPISLLLYFLGLAGLGFMVYRRKREDKYLLLWFSVVYVVFTLIPNREWRYVTIAFPVLAISAASLLTTTFDKLRKIWQTAQKSLTRKWGTKIAATLIIAFTLTGVFFSCSDAYGWVTRSQVQIPIDQATYYAAQGLSQNQTLVVACPLNQFNQYMLYYYLSVKNPDQNNNQTWQYPALAADAYTPDFNTTEFILRCQEFNAKYVLLYEYNNWQYFESTLTEQKVQSMLNETGRFSLEATFGAEPNRIFVMSFS
jgi:4-amino-4-deoxy-L-arabinose transferase-like glycosyltransferase